MKEKLNSLVKKILLGATAALTATPGQGLANCPYSKPYLT
jgi:hypothetical protein